MSSQSSKKPVMTCGNCGGKGHNKKSKSCPENPNVDHSRVNITPILKKKERSEEEGQLIKEYVSDLIEGDKSTRKRQLEIGAKYGKTPRSYGLCQEASQGLVMLLYNHKLNDKTCRQPDSGDLISDIDGKIECKCKTSKNKAPGSCGGEQGWNTLIYVDGSGFQEDKYKVLKLPVPNTDNRWDQFKPANKDKSKKKERPRLNWDKIFAVFVDDFKVIYEGSFEDIFKDAQAQ
jgi:hypothetical protein